MRITDYPKTDTIETGDVFVIDGERGTGIIDADSLGIVSSTPSVIHRNTYRGKYIGDEYTEEQMEAVRTGSFDDLYVGDYWTINGRDWIIADIDYWYGTYSPLQGYTNKIETHHLVIIPRNCVCKSEMNIDNGLTRQYYNSSLYKGLRGEAGGSGGSYIAKSIIQDAFPDNKILSRANVIVGYADSNYTPTSAIWVESKIDIMNQRMIIGASVFTATGSPGTYVSNFSQETTQLSVFRMNPSLIADNQTNYWTRDFYAGGKVTTILRFNAVDCISQTDNTIGVRPYFGLVG